MAATLELALMAGRAYEFTRNPRNKIPTPDGWSLMKPEKTDSNGFEAVSFVRQGTTLKTSPEIVISFAGTDPDNSNPFTTADGKTNKALSDGRWTEQLLQAARYYLDIKAVNPNAAITFTGHSLGGGLAALMAVFFGEHAQTFDQAPFALSALDWPNGDNASELQRRLAAITITRNGQTARLYNDNALSGLTLYAGKYHAQLLEAAKYYQNIRLKCPQAIRTAFSKFGSILTLAIAVCGSPAIAADTWKEEVLLPDGQALLVERWTLRRGRSEIGQQAPIQKESLEFVHPTTRQSITWASLASPDLRMADLAPIALQVVDATPYLVAYPVGCLAYNKWGRPNPPYVLFRYTASTWQRIELQQLPQALQKLNLIISSPDNEVQRLGTRNVSAAMVERVNGELKQPEFHAILREPFSQDQILAMCDVLLNYKGYWIDPRNPFARKHIDEEMK